MTSSTRSLAGALSAAVLAAVFASAAAAQSAPLGTPIPQQPLGKATAEAGGGMAFAANQLTFSRVAAARKSTEADLRMLFHEKGIRYPAPEIFLRVFKHERELELWVRSHPDSAFALLKEYPVCALPGQLGPKRRLGDVQVPEGFYFIDEFNPESAYHLSLRVSYPNLADRMRRQALALGGDIFIHGGCATIGCVPIENRNIEEVYWLAVQAMDAGQRVIPVHIFPTRLDAKRIQWLEENFDPEPDLLAFWKNLADGYAFFEETRRVPWVTVAADGNYAVPEWPRLAASTPADAPPAAAGDTATPPHTNRAPAVAAGEPGEPGDEATAASPAGGPLGATLVEEPTQPAADSAPPPRPTGPTTPAPASAADSAGVATAAADTVPPAPADSGLAGVPLPSAGVAPPPDSAGTATPLPDTAGTATPLPDSAGVTAPLPDSAGVATPLPDSAAVAAPPAPAVVPPDTAARRPSGPAGRPRRP